jgi:predicted DNA-binding protein (MmcQ/YjbR family)
VSDVFDRPVFARARRLCLSYPDTKETSSWGHPNFRVGGKAFCTFEMIDGRPSFAFRLPTGEIEQVSTSAQGFVTPYGRGCWATLWVDGDVDWSRVKTLIDLSYRTVANKRMLRTLDGSTVTPRRRNR